ncbi:MAG: hypothetical protein Q4D38_07960 [Planctomycetia bacterium]|nr:hypothetical protein [Planctomycetia bacterium]
MARIIQRSRWCFLRWTIFILIVFAALGAFVLFREIDTFLYRHVMETTQKKFPNAAVLATNARLVEGSGIEITRLALMADYPQQEGQSPFLPVLEAERVLLAFPESLKDLVVTKDVQIREVLLENAVIRAYRRLDGTWSLGALKIDSPASKHPTPRILFRNATIELHDMMDVGQERKLTLRNVSLSIETSQKTAQGAVGATLENGTPFFPFSGEAECEFCPEIQFSGRFYPQLGTVQIELDAAGLRFSEKFISAIPLEVAAKFETIQSIRGEVSGKFRVVASLADFAQAKFHLQGKLSDGRTLDPKLHRTISKINTDFVIANEGFYLPNLNMQHGSGSAIIELSQRGYGSNAQKHVRSKLRNIILNEEIFALLPQSLQKLLRELQPVGRIDMDGTLRFDGTRWHTEGTVVCRDAAIQYRKFPYRIENLNGKIQLTGKNAIFEFKTLDHRVTLSGDFSYAPQAGESQGGKLRVQGESIPVDERLVSACPREVAEFLRALEIGGAVNMEVVYSSLNQNDCRVSIELIKNSCRYRNFPYPLRDLEGRIEIVNDRVLAQQLRGGNNNTQVVFSCGVQLPRAIFAPDDVDMMYPPKNTEFHFVLDGENVTLDDELYANLPPSASRLFRYIRPQGAVDVHYEYRMRNGQNDHMLLRVATPEEGLTIDFPEIPYRLDKFHGLFAYENGAVSLVDFRGEHGASRLAGTLAGKVDSPDEWFFRVENLVVDNVRFDRELMLALPVEMRTTLAARRPEGTLFFSGLLDFRYNRTNSRPLAFSWKGRVGIAEGGVDFGIKLTNIAGGADVAGVWDGEEFFCGCELDIDSLFYQNAQFTNVSGPVWIDSTQILMGGAAQKKIAQNLMNAFVETSATAPRALSSKFAGGDVYANGSVSFGFPSTFQTEVVVTNSRLEECAYLTGNNQLSGRILAVLNLSGSEASLHSLRGTGEIHLLEANIYKLSAMMALLKILSLKEVNNDGFSSGEMKFHIEGNHVYFDQINFYGDAFSLIGKGEMDFRQQIQLVFYSVMGRGERYIPVISPLLHATGRQMMLISMRGPLQNPDITQQPLPGLNMAIQQLDRELPLSSSSTNRRERLLDFR